MGYEVNMSYTLRHFNIDETLVPNKVQAWQDLRRLIQDENRWVRDESAKALMSVFSQVPDKNLAWKDLHVLTHDTDRNVRLTAAKALISVFSHIPDKDQAWRI
jgi:HEAT repeat protein